MFNIRIESHELQCILNYFWYWEHDRMKAYQLRMFCQEYVFIKYAIVIYVAMCCQSLISDAWVHAYISVQNICTLIRQAD
jgi:hypothetical protein